MSKVRPGLIGSVLAGLCLVAVVDAPVCASEVSDAATRAYAAVDPMIGTGGDGHTFPGATVPFGMIQLSPDTEIMPFKQSYKWAAGYRYEDSSIIGFSHTHFSGTGHSDLGDVLLMPIAGEVRLDPGSSAQPRSGYRSRFEHAQESAQPGYYAVTLADYGIRAELTATERVGLHRYTFPVDQPAHVLIDLRTSIYDYPGKIGWSRLRLRADGVVSGARTTRGWAPQRELFFALRFSRAPSGHALHNREDLIEYKGFKGPGDAPADLVQIEGKRIVGVFDFSSADTRPLLVKVSISAVSEANALANLDHGMPGWNFDETRAAARTRWSEALGVIDIEADAATRTSFYTSLYHTLMAPSLFMDSDGRFRGPDNAVHSAQGFAFHSTFSLWDTYRALHPLMTLIQPDARNRDFVRSLIASQQVSPWGILPVWQFHGRETWCMIGYHAVSVIADAYLKGITGIPADEALKAMVASADHAAYGGLDDYMKLGYVAIDREAEAASKTLEYAYDDWTIARMAAAMGQKDIAARFQRRASNWRNVFDRKTGFARARRSDGSFKLPFDPVAVGYGSDYTEGNAWQYSWYVPQDIAGLGAALGGDDALVARLDAVFDTKVDPAKFAHVEDISGLIGYYAHGNEPSHHIAYLYAYAGQAWRGQARLSQIMRSQYAPKPDGLSGNDDLGQMSAWYVFTALGFYPVAPGSNEYVIGRPFVERATMNLPSGKRFNVIAENLGEEHPYVGRVSLNGQVLQRSFLRHAEILAGGELRFTMQSTPNREWATRRDARPYSMSSAGGVP